MFSSQPPRGQDEAEPLTAEGEAEWDKVNLINELDGEGDGGGPSGPPPFVPLTAADTATGSAGAVGEEDLALPVDEDDEEAMDLLTTWLVEYADILPSLARKFASMFVNDGVGT
jgi:hypothetical protein